MLKYIGDFKELKKFGFEDVRFHWVNTINSIMYEISVFNGKISIATTTPMLSDIDDLLYDLIKAELVEKIEDEK
ncbi:MAG: hypothetical protein KAX49_07390 [Halanaerobiales bacterium]|nr:hypothetical protein [Halanaerobiales bacterium]